MTYCVGILLNDGIVMASDSRTNAGVDHVACYTKMFNFCWPGKRQMTIVSSGNLATTQAVISRLQLENDASEKKRSSLKNSDNLEECAAHLGKVCQGVREQHEKNKNGHQPLYEASFILGGQIKGQSPGLYLVYPEGNYIAPSPYNPFLQIGETKYGKPILDRFITKETSLDHAARCALVSLDSAMRANLSVGPPLDLILYRLDAFDGGTLSRFPENHPYLTDLKKSWNKGLKRIFKRLPRFEWEETPENRDPRLEG